MVRDLVELSINMVKAEEQENVQAKAAEIAEERILDLLLPPRLTERNVSDMLSDHPADQTAVALEEDEKKHDASGKMRRWFKEGKFDDKMVELEVSEPRSGPMIEIFSAAGMEDMGLNLKDMLGNMMPQKKKKRNVKVPEALEILEAEEAQKLIDMEKVTKTALERVEQSGIIFLDEIDKIVGGDSQHGPDVSREGVQRDLLPIVEGSNVNTRYGMVKRVIFSLLPPALFPERSRPI